MQIELFSERLNNLTDKNSDFNYKLGDVITEVDIRKAEKRLDLKWNILNKVSEYEITKTISSFWSNKIWQWLEKENKIWNDDWWI